MRFLVISCTVDMMVYSMKYIWSSNMVCWEISQLVRRFSQLQTFVDRICSVAGGYIMLIHVIYLDISRNKQVYIMWIFHGIWPANSLDKWHFFLSSNFTVRPFWDSYSYPNPSDVVTWRDQICPHEIGWTPGVPKEKCLAPMNICYSKWFWYWGNRRKQSSDNNKGDLTKSDKQLLILQREQHQKLRICSFLPKDSTGWLWRPIRFGPCLAQFPTIQYSARSLFKFQR